MNMKGYFLLDINETKRNYSWLNVKGCWKKCLNLLGFIFIEIQIPLFFGRFLTHPI